MASSEVNGSSGMDLGHEAAFSVEIDRKYVCPICLVVMRDAVQTSCGHRFCQVCILKVAKGSEMCKCPVDNTWFHMTEELFPDVATRREILSLKVECQQYGEGCTWTGELRDLEKHLSSCAYIRVQCEYGCSMQCIRRMDLEHHLETCDQRPVSCEHCNSSTTWVDLTKHQLLDCRKFPVACSLCLKTGISRENIPYHISMEQGDCPRVIIPCSYMKYGCNFSGRREIMSNHEKEASHIHLHHMKQKIETQVKLNLSFEKQLSHLEKTLEDQKVKFEDAVTQLKQSQTTSYSGKLVWKVKIMPGQNKYNSRSFYTGCPGYKLYASLELNGHTESGQSYASLFVIYEKGEFDNELCFPFSAVCLVSVYARHPGKSHVARVTCTSVPRCWSDEEPFSCQRGRLRFIPMEKLLSDFYCEDSCIFLDIRVDVHQLGEFRRESSFGSDICVDQ